MICYLPMRLSESENDQYSLDNVMQGMQSCSFIVQIHCVADRLVILKSVVLDFRE